MIALSYGENAYELLLEAPYGHIYRVHTSTRNHKRRLGLRVWPALC